MKLPEGALNVFKANGLKGMTSSEVKTIRPALIDNWGSKKDFIAAIKDPNFSEERLSVIYDNETHLAGLEANKVDALSGGMETKTWIAGGDNVCPECEAMDGESVGIDEDYSNGENVANAHVGCQCEDAFGNPKQHNQASTVKVLNASWNGDQAKNRVLAHFTNADAKISKKGAAPWFGHVALGDGQNKDDYSYPLGDMAGDKPTYIKEGLQAAFGAASGAHTGMVNRAIQARMVRIFRREFGKAEMGKDMADFVDKHLNARTSNASASATGKIVYPQFPADIKTGEEALQFLKEHNIDKVELETIPLAEGVFTGTDGIPTLKLFKNFKNTAHWLNGIPITPEHVAVPGGDAEVMPWTPRVGKLWDVHAREAKKDVRGISQYFTETLTPEKLTKFLNNEPIPGSLEYRADMDYTPGVYEGKEYKRIEDNYVPYNYAEALNGAACEPPRCGILLNGSDNMAGEQVPAQPDIKKVVEEAIGAILKPVLDTVAKVDERLGKVEGTAKVLNESDTKRQEAEAKVLDDRRKGAFKKQLNAANAAKIDEHWTQAKTVGESLYLDEHPEIRQITKQMNSALVGQINTPAVGTPDGDARQKMVDRLRTAGQKAKA